MTEAMEKMERGRGRGRPRDADKDIAIRDAFWSLLSARGYEGLTFEAIAEVAGCSRATLYRRFPGKLDLVFAMLDETSRSIEPALPADVDPRDAFRAHSTGAAAYMSGARGPAILSLSDAGARIPELKRALDRFKVQEREFYYDIFRKLVPEASEERMAFVFDSFIGMMIQNIIIEGRGWDDQRREMIIDMTLYALRY